MRKKNNLSTNRTDEQPEVRAPCGKTLCFFRHKFFVKAKLLTHFAYSFPSQVFIVNLVYDFYRNWSTLKKTIQDVRWNQDSYKFARRMFSVLVSMMVFLLARLALLQGSLPRFSQQDNPAAFHSSFQTRFLTFLYLSSFNLWLLLCPSQLSHDWQMGSIPLVLNFRDARNILTVFTISAIICLVYKIYNDLEVSVVDLCT